MAASAPSYLPVLASSSSSSPSSASSALVKCSRCEEAYDSGDRTPRLLRNCGHTICERCLREIGAQTDDGFVATCPTCQTETKLRSIDQFHRNLVLIEHIEWDRAQTRGPQCQVCTEQAAEFGCAQCAITYCSTCWSKDHELGNRATHQRGSVLDAAQVYCNKHKDKPTDYMCVDPSCPSTGVLICFLCKDSPDHKGHQIELLEQVFADKCKEQVTAVRRLEDSTAFATRTLEHVNNNIDLLEGAQNNQAAAIAEIRDYFEQQHRLLRLREAELIQQVETLTNSKMDKLNLQKAELEAFLRRSYAVQKDTTQAMQSKSERVFLSSFGPLRDQAAELSETLLFPEPVVTPVVKAVFGPQLSDAIRTCGAVPDDGDVVQSRMTSYTPEIPVGALEGQVPKAVRDAYGRRVQMHRVAWDAARCHAEIERSDDGFTLKCTGSTQQPRNCLGRTSTAPGGFTAGVHYFSVRITNPGPSGYVFAGFVEGKIPTAGTDYAFPGSNFSNGDLGAALFLANGNVYHPVKDHKVGVLAGARVCSMGVLLDLDAGRFSFFVDGKNNFDDGPYPHYQVPPGKSWLPYVSLYNQNMQLTSEACRK